MAEPSRISIGRILSAWGVKGEVKVAPLTDWPERFRTTEGVYLDPPGEWRVIENARPHQDRWVLKFLEIDDRDQAAALRGSLLEVEPSDLRPLPEGHYYVFQLIGLEVKTVGGRMIGTLTDVNRTGANDVYVVETPDDREVLIPAVREFVESINLESQEMHVVPRPGLLE